jgi:SAM-dependent methyltransferase
VTLFGGVACEYDAARPAYPDALLDALGPVANLRVLDVGAGTGLATRPLIERGALVVAIEPEAKLLARAVEHTPNLAAMIADGARLPLRDRCVDLVCFAQSWHWLHPDTRTGELARVLRPGGRWAVWWSHARADGEQWFDGHWRTIEHACPGVSRTQRDTDWGLTVAADGRFDVADRVAIPWRRTVTVDEWMLDQASHSYIAALPTKDRRRLLNELRNIVQNRFPDGTMAVPYETWLSTAMIAVDPFEHRRHRDSAAPLDAPC